MQPTTPYLLPAHACDTHSHVYGDLERYRPLPGQRVDPGTCLEDYLALARSFGVQRHVFVQAKAYGEDPACMLDAISQLGVAHARGILMGDAPLSAAELARFDQAGIRGLRFLFPGTNPVDVQRVQQAAHHIADLGWSLLVQADGLALADCLPALTALPCPVVIDHLGRMPVACDVDSPPFQALLRFVEAGGWVKIAAPYYATPHGEADFMVIESRVHALLDVCSDRLIWGMNWPHPNFTPGSKPDDTACLHSLLRVLRSPGEKQRLFVDNPARLYGFANE